MRLRGHSRREFARGKSYLNARLRPPRRESEAIQSHSMVRLQPRFMPLCRMKLVQNSGEGMKARPARHLCREAEGELDYALHFLVFTKSRHKTWERVQWSGEWSAGRIYSFLHSILPDRRIRKP